MYCDWPQLGRCCFCMPLRKGVLTFAYIHMFMSAFMVGLYSHTIYYETMTDWMVYGKNMYLPAEISVAFFCLEVIFTALLIYGAHKKILAYLKVFYYYTVTTCVAMLVMQLVKIGRMNRMFLGRLIEWGIFAFASLCLQIYLITLVWSLIKKLEISSPHVYDNQLHQIVSGELKMENNGVYNNTTVVQSNVQD